MGRDVKRSAAVDFRGGARSGPAPSLGVAVPPPAERAEPNLTVSSCQRLRNPECRGISLYANKGNLKTNGNTEQLFLKFFLWYASEYFSVSVNL